MKEYVIGKLVIIVSTNKWLTLWKIASLLHWRIMTGKIRFPLDKVHSVLFIKLKSWILKKVIFQSSRSIRCNQKVCTTKDLLGLLDFSWITGKATSHKEWFYCRMYWYSNLLKWWVYCYGTLLVWSSYLPYKVRMENAWKSDSNHHEPYHWSTFSSKIARFLFSLCKSKELYNKRWNSKN